MNALLPTLIEPEPLALPVDVAVRDAMERERLREEEERSEVFLRSLLERRPGNHLVRVV